ncbi:sugar ABC transporter substrate-binding protein [Catonella massiliensis]|uniref:Extracellular solute-binding protein n=1 Tax=Catonella massiliensis TaxID=2799636 RepID=A0ABS1IWC8_9FIRM|nr:extracellular solute-binding protein [Catonella massiliensis]MBK5896201.1 extracellular solute-binding protein [Catonella massiliensis]
MKRKSILILTTIISLSIAACGSNSSNGNAESSSSKKQDMKVENQEKSTTSSSNGLKLKLMLTGAGVWEDKLQPIVDKYQEKTGVKVEFECYEHTNYFPALEAIMSTKSSDVDIIGVDAPMTSGYVESGYITPLNDYLTDDEIKEFVPAAILAGSWKGKFYAPPMNNSAQALYYNKGLLEQAGIKIPEPDPSNRLTWEEVVEMSNKALKVLDPEKTKGINGIVFEQSNTAYQMLALPESLGEAAIGKDGYTVDGVINTPGWIKAMTFFHDLYEDGLSPRGLSSMENQGTFTSGKTLFFVGGIWCASLDYADGVNWDYTYTPAFKGYENKVATCTGSWHLGVSAFSEHKKEAAEFVKFLTLGEGNDMWLKANGDIPARVSVVESYMNDKKYAEYPLSIQRIAAFEAANTAVPRPITPAYSEYESLINAMLSDISNGADPTEAIKSCVEKTDSIMKKYK